MDLRPLHDRVLVKRLDEGEQKIGGIIIPDTAKEKPQQAEVKAVGNGKLLDSGERVALDVKPGDRILFGKYTRFRHQDRWRRIPDLEGRRDSRGLGIGCANLRIYTPNQELFS
jgi:chaperonin GroES